MPLMTQKAYAKRKGVSPQYVNKLVGQGKIKRVGRKIDSRQANAVIKAFQRPGRVPPAKRSRSKPAQPKAPGAAGALKPRPSATRNLTEARAEKEHYGALAAKLDYERAAGALLPRPEVLDLERRKNANIRTLLRRLPRSVAPLLARAGGPAEIEKLLLSEIDLILGQLAHNPLGMHDEAAPPVAELSAMAPIAAAAKEIAEAS